MVRNPLNMPFHLAVFVRSGKSGSYRLGWAALRREAAYMGGMRSMRRLYCFIVAATATAALATSSAAAASVTTELSGAAAAAGCAQVTFVGVKGSGDGSSGAGMGTTIAALAASFTADLPAG